MLPLHTMAGPSGYVHAAHSSPRPPAPFSTSARSPYDHGPSPHGHGHGHGHGPSPSAFTTPPAAGSSLGPTPPASSSPATATAAAAPTTTTTTTTRKRPRKYASKTCSECRRRKIACVPSDPDPQVCKRCFKMNLHCTLAEEKARGDKKRRRRKPPSDAAAAAAAAAASGSGSASSRAAHLARKGHRNGLSLGSQTSSPRDGAGMSSNDDQDEGSEDASEESDEEYVGGGGGGEAPDGDFAGENHVRRPPPLSSQHTGPPQPSKGQRRSSHHAAKHSRVDDQPDTGFIYSIKEDQDGSSSIVGAHTQQGPLGLGPPQSALAGTSQSAVNRTGRDPNRADPAPAPRSSAPTRTRDAPATSSTRPSPREPQSRALEAPKTAAQRAADQNVMLVHGCPLWVYSDLMARFNLLNAKEMESPRNRNALARLDAAELNAKVAQLPDDLIQTIDDILEDARLIMPHIPLLRNLLAQQEARYDSARTLLITLLVFVASNGGNPIHIQKLPRAVLAEIKDYLTFQALDSIMFSPIKSRELVIAAEIMAVYDPLLGHPATGRLETSRFIVPTSFYLDLAIGFAYRIGVGDSVQKLQQWYTEASAGGLYQSIGDDEIPDDIADALIDATIWTSLELHIAELNRNFQGVTNCFAKNWKPLWTRYTSNNDRAPALSSIFQFCSAKLPDATTEVGKTGFSLGAKLGLVNVSFRQDGLVLIQDILATLYEGIPDVNKIDRYYMQLEDDLTNRLKRFADQSQSQLTSSGPQDPTATALMNLAHDMLERELAWMRHFYGGYCFAILLWLPKLKPQAPPSLGGGDSEAGDVDGNDADVDHAISSIDLHEHGIHNSDIAGSVIETIKSQQTDPDQMMEGAAQAQPLRRRKTAMTSFDFLVKHNPGHEAGLQRWMTLSLETTSRLRSANIHRIPTNSRTIYVCKEIIENHATRRRGWGKVGEGASIHIGLLRQTCDHFKNQDNVLDRSLARLTKILEKILDGWRSPRPQSDSTRGGRSDGQAANRGGEAVKAQHAQQPGASSLAAAHPVNGPNASGNSSATSALRAAAAAEHGQGQALRGQAVPAQPPLYNTQSHMQQGQGFAPAPASQQQQQHLPHQATSQMGNNYAPGFYPPQHQQPRADMGYLPHTTGLDADGRPLPAPYQPPLDGGMSHLSLGSGGGVGVNGSIGQVPPGSQNFRPQPQEVGASSLPGYADPMHSQPHLAPQRSVDGAQQWPGDAAVPGQGSNFVFAGGDSMPTVQGQGACLPQGGSGTIGQAGPNGHLYECGGGGMDFGGTLDRAAAGPGSADYDSGAPKSSGPDLMDLNLLDLDIFTDAPIDLNVENLFFDNWPSMPQMDFGLNLPGMPPGGGGGGGRPRTETDSSHMRMSSAGTTTTTTAAGEEFDFDEVSPGYAARGGREDAQPQAQPQPQREGAMPPGAGAGAGEGMDMMSGLFQSV